MDHSAWLDSAISQLQRVLLQRRASIHSTEPLIHKHHTLDLTTLDTLIPNQDNLTVVQTLCRLLALDDVFRARQPDILIRFMLGKCLARYHQALDWIIVLILRLMESPDIELGMRSPRINMLSRFGVSQKEIVNSFASMRIEELSCRLKGQCNFLSEENFNDLHVILQTVKLTELQVDTRRLMNCIVTHAISSDCSNRLLQNFLSERNWEFHIAASEPKMLFRLIVGKVRSLCTEDFNTFSVFTWFNELLIVASFRKWPFVATVILFISKCLGQIALQSNTISARFAAIGLYGAFHEYLRSEHIVKFNNQVPSVKSYVVTQCRSLVPLLNYFRDSKETISKQILNAVKNFLKDPSVSDEDLWLCLAQYPAVCSSLICQCLEYELEDIEESELMDFVVFYTRMIDKSVDSHSYKLLSRVIKSNFRNTHQYVVNRSSSRSFGTAWVMLHWLKEPVLFDKVKLFAQCSDDDMDFVLRVFQLTKDSSKELDSSSKLSDF